MRSTCRVGIPRQHNQAPTGSGFHLQANDHPVRGKHEDEGGNIKFVDDAENMEEAQRMIQEKKLYTFQFAGLK